VRHALFHFALDAAQLHRTILVIHPFFRGWFKGHVFWLVTHLCEILVCQFFYLGRSQMCLAFHPFCHLILDYIWHLETSQQLGRRLRLFTIVRIFFGPFQLVDLEVARPPVSLVLEDCVPVVNFLGGHSSFRP